MEKLFNRRSRIFLVFQILVLLPGSIAFGQNHILKAGFDRSEYISLMQMHLELYDTMTVAASKGKPQIPKPTGYQSLYKSKVMGLDNRWQLWKQDNAKVAVINLRGTTQNPVGWLENFYAAMVAPSGELKLSKDFKFKYYLAENPRAGIHIGWLVGMAYLANDIYPKLDSCYKAGIKDFLIMGHSQGGALGFLLSAQLHFMQKQGTLPKDIRFKTYCSASPKVGNTYFAYEYEAAMRGGWAYNVVNAADWVPEVPFSVQTLDDFNTTNPFKNIDGIIKKQKLIARIAMRHAYKKMRNPSMKAQKNYNKYLGGYASKAVRKTLPEFEPPVYINSSNYVRTGPTIALIPDAEYYKTYPDSDKEIFIHHLPQAYLDLVKKLDL